MGSVALTIFSVTLTHFTLPAEISIASRRREALPRRPCSASKQPIPAALAGIGHHLSLGVMILRRTRPDLKRSFRTPVIWLTGPVAVLSCGYLMISLPVATWERFII